MSSLNIKSIKEKMVNKNLNFLFISKTNKNKFFIEKSNYIYDIKNYNLYILANKEDFNDLDLDKLLKRIIEKTNTKNKRIKCDITAEKVLEVIKKDNFNNIIYLNINKDNTKEFYISNNYNYDKKYEVIELNVNDTTEEVIKDKLNNILFNFKNSKAEYRFKDEDNVKFYF